MKNSKDVKPVLVKIQKHFEVMRAYISLSELSDKQIIACMVAFYESQVASPDSEALGIDYNQRIVNIKYFNPQR